jgi:hypothetical protein
MNSRDCVIFFSARKVEAEIIPQKQNPAGTADRVCAEKMTEGESVTRRPIKDLPPY